MMCHHEWIWNPIIPKLCLFSLSSNERREIMSQRKNLTITLNLTECGTMFDALQALEREYSHRRISFNNDNVKRSYRLSKKLATAILNYQNGEK